MPTVLVVDDSETDRRFAGGLLEKSDDWVVIFAADGKQALLLFSTAFRDRATRLRRVLAQRGFKAQIKRSDFGSGRTVYRVIVPDQADRDSAVATGRELQKLFRQDDEFAAVTR